MATTFTKKAPVKVNTIGQWLGLRTVSSTNPNNLGLTLPKIVSFPNTLFGVEIELEHTQSIRPKYLMEKEDGSLRNHGMEYVSYPWPYDWLVPELTSFYKDNKISERNVSERCSVHVHLNCQELTIPQLLTLIKLYQVFERVLFHWIGDDRSRSIFCVPLSETMINQKIINPEPNALLRTIKSWQKYTAFNLLPLLTQGTVEFRHMSGQGTPKKIIEWLAIIGSMYEYVLKNTGDRLDEFLLQLNSSSQYTVMTETVFGKYTTLFDGFNFQLLMEDGVLNMKSMMLDTQNKPVSIGATNEAFDFADALARVRMHPLPQVPVELADIHEEVAFQEQQEENRV